MCVFPRVLPAFPSLFHRLDSITAHPAHRAFFAHLSEFSVWNCWERVYCCRTYWQSSRVCEIGLTPYQSPPPLEHEGQHKRVHSHEKAMHSCIYLPYLHTHTHTHRRTTSFVCSDASAFWKTTSKRGPVALFAQSLWLQTHIGTKSQQRREVIRVDGKSQAHTSPRRLSASGSSLFYKRGISRHPFFTEASQVFWCCVANRVHLSECGVSGFAQQRANLLPLCESAPEWSLLEAR